MVGLMANEPLVSVVIAFLNARKYIQEAIDSVLAQTYRHWELIVVDDGSTDGSSEIAASLVKKANGRIHYYDHPGHRNLGISASRNVGIRRATGELIATLDGDDVWLPQKLDQQIAILNANRDAAMVYGDTLQWRSWNAELHHGKEDTVPTFRLKPERSYAAPQLVRMIVRGRIPAPSMSSICFRRELFERTGGFEETFPAMYEDQVFMAKVFLHETVYVSSQMWDKHRLHPESCVAVSDKNNRSFAAREAYLMWVQQYIRSQKFTDTTTVRAVEDALWDIHHPTITRMRSIMRSIPERSLRILRMVRGVKPKQIPIPFLY
jgi:glycosyltransferase involved in cell wall biosynthesis